MGSKLRRGVCASWLLLLGACAQQSSELSQSALTNQTASATAAPLRPVWFRTGGGATRIGPALPKGTMVLLGGRRALVLPDQSVIPEHVASPEPLLDLALVPTLKGDVLFGHGLHTVYRFDDPLGAATAVVGTLDRVEIDHIGAGPGVLMVWGFFWGRYNDEAPPIVIDAVNGTEVKLAGWPEVRINDIAFRTMNEGAAIFDGLGLGLTGDGGKTFRAANADKPEEVRLFHRLGRWDKQFVVKRAEFFAPLDLTSGRVSSLSREPRDMPPMLEWIARTATDPLALAVTEGSLDQHGRMLVAVDGTAARVDPATGAVYEVKHFGDTEFNQTRTPESVYTSDRHWPTPQVGCLTAAYLPQEGMLLCPSLGARRVALQGPLDPQPFRAFDPEGHQYKVRDLVHKSGGGFAFFGACSKREGGERVGSMPMPADRLCTLQKGGTFETIKAPEGFPLYTERDGLGALADGRIVYLDQDPHVDFRDEGDPLPKVFFVVFDARGAVRKFPPLQIPGARFPTRAIGGIEEGADNALHALVSAGNGLLAVRQPWDGPATITPLPAGMGELRRGRGVALGQEMLISSDAGASWVSAGPYPPLPEGYSSDDKLVVGEGGVRVDDWLRVGWGAGAPFVPSTTVAAAPLFLPSKPPTEAPQRRLVCKTGAVIDSAPPLWDQTALVALFDRARGPLRAAGKSQDWTLQWNGYGHLVRMSAFADDPQATSPTRWILQFFDPRERNGKVHTWEGAAPAGVPFFGFGVEGTYRVGKGMLFSVAHHASKYDDEPSLTTWDVALVPEKGAVRWTRLTRRKLRKGDHDSLEITPGEDESDPVLLRNRSGLYIWEANGTLRVLPALGNMILGRGRGKTAPVLLHGHDWAATREVSLDTASGSSFLPFDGWRSLPFPSKNALANLEGCGPSDAGTVFPSIYMNGNLTVVLDGQEPSVPWTNTRYDVRVADGVPCIAGVELQDRRTQGPGPPFGFIMADIAGKSGHAIERKRGGKVRRIECVLE